MPFVKKISREVPTGYGVIAIDFWAPQDLNNQQLQIQDYANFFRSQYPAPFYFLNQAHGNQICNLDERLTEKSPNKSENKFDIFYGDFDGVFCSQKSIPLAIRVADCLPLVIFSKQKPLLAALHCGWRSVYADIIATAFQKINPLLDEPNLHYWIGPHIQADDYEVGPEFQQYFDFHSLKKKNNSDKYTLDLTQAVKDKLTLIEIHQQVFAQDALFPTWVPTPTPALTKNQNEQSFCSHRMGQSGRNVLVCQIKSKG